MDLLKAMRERHSVRSYTDRPLSGEIKERLKKAVDAANRRSGLHIQLITNEGQAFSGMMARYGKFSGVNNYFALIGKDDRELEEKCGYYGEELVLLSQTLGLNTCWVALSYKKIPEAYTIDKGEKLLMVIALGYGENEGIAHRSRPYQAVVKAENEPEWFKSGVEAALLAPTALNQQKFLFTLKGDRVQAKAKHGPYSKTDLGIVKYHFELGSGKGHDIWL